MATKSSIEAHLLNVSANAEALDLRDKAWAEVQVPLDRQLEPLGRRALTALSARLGERILDIGCGTGQTSIELGQVVGSEGNVLGVDISAVVLEIAIRRAGSCAQVHFANGDAQMFPFELGAFDAAFSRFGVMFFSDPVAAFANLRRALKPGGRLAFVCWRSLEENELDYVPLKAASPNLDVQWSEQVAAPPFSFAEPDRVFNILAGAGFENIVITPHDEEVGTGDLESMLELSLRVGSLGKLLRESPKLRERVIDLVQKELAARDGPMGPRLNAAIWIVTARSPSGLGGRRTTNVLL